jgi:hypothetical protein
VCEREALRQEHVAQGFAYVARWSEGSTDLLKETGERVIACAKQILASLEADQFVS